MFYEKPFFTLQEIAPFGAIQYNNACTEAGIGNRRQQIRRYKTLLHRYRRQGHRLRVENNPYPEGHYHSQF